MKRAVSVLLVCVLLLECIVVAESTHALGPLGSLIATNPYFMMSAAALATIGVIWWSRDVLVPAIANLWEDINVAGSKVAEWMQRQRDKGNGYMNFADMDAETRAEFDNALSRVVMENFAFYQAVDPELGCLNDDVLRFDGSVAGTTYMMQDAYTPKKEWDGTYTVRLAVLKTPNGGNFNFSADYVILDSTGNVVKSGTKTGGIIDAYAPTPELDGNITGGLVLMMASEVPSECSLHFFPKLTARGTKNASSSGYELCLDSVRGARVPLPDAMDAGQFAWVSSAGVGYAGDPVVALPTSGAVAVPANVDDYANGAMYQNPSMEVETYVGDVGAAQVGDITEVDATYNYETTPAGVVEAGFSFVGVLLKPIRDVVTNIWGWLQSFGASLVGLIAEALSLFLPTIPIQIRMLFPNLVALIAAFVALFGKAIAFLVGLMNVPADSSMIPDGMMEGIARARAMSYGGVTLYGMITGVCSLALGVLVFRGIRRMVLSIGEARVGE